MEEYQMPKLIVKLSKEDIQTIKEKKKKRGIFFAIVLILILIALIVFLLIRIIPKKKAETLVNNTGITNIEVLSYNQEDNEINISLGTENEQIACAYSKNEEESSLSFNDTRDGRCLLTVPFEPVFIYFKNSEGTVSSGIELNNYVVDFNVESKYYVPLKSKGELTKGILSVGEPNITIVKNDDIVEINNLSYVANKNGRSKVVIKNGELQSEEFDFVVTNTIVNLPKEFDTKKPYLSCEQFTEEEAVLLDEILEYRIASAGYGTRAGAVAAARFLTLEFPYKISYYFENGRLNGTGTHYVDGEGRYYHKGLYLSKSKYNDLVPGAKLKGPQMWGCKMISYEDDRVNGYIPGRKYPNGLDCSGFVSWVLLNGGFDVGDGGAGESPAIDGQMTDTGDYKHLTQSMIKNGEVRVGDLLNIYGHIAIIIGDDGDNFYVAESLNNYRGVVMKKYAKSKVIKSFTYVVLMDSVYESDGNLTNMWY